MPATWRHVAGGKREGRISLGNSVTEKLQIGMLVQLPPDSCSVCHSRITSINGLSIKSVRPSGEMWSMALEPTSLCGSSNSTTVDALCGLNDITLQGRMDGQIPGLADSRSTSNAGRRVLSAFPEPHGLKMLPYHDGRCVSG